MFFESETLEIASAVAGIVAAILLPPLGLVVLAFMGPLKPPSVIPAPGFDAILVGALLLGCVYRLPTVQTRLRAGPALLFMSGFVLYVFVQQLPDMVSGYAGDSGHDVGYLFIQLMTGFGAVIAAALVLRGRSPYPVLVALVLSATAAAGLGILTAHDLPLARLANLCPPLTRRAGWPVRSAIRTRLASFSRTGGSLPSVGSRARARRVVGGCLSPPSASWATGSGYPCPVEQSLPGWPGWSCLRSAGTEPWGSLR